MKNMVVRKTAHKNSSRALRLKLFGLLVLAGLILAGLELTDKTYLFHDRPPKPSTATTTSTLPTAQQNFTQGTDRDVVITDKKEGIVKDNQGSITATPPESQWTTSSDKSITVYSPTKNQLTKSGDALIGASSLTKVSFRIIDDISGLIAQGTLSVVAGKFSGKFDFVTTGTNGRLDIFNMSAEGNETSNIEIPIRFR